MSRISVATRISIALACLTLSVLLVAVTLGFFPNTEQAILDSRKSLCEAFAVQCCIAAQRNDVSTIQSLADEMLTRNESVLSLGIRRANGKLVARAGDHAAQWDNKSEVTSTETQVTVPIKDRRRLWGTIEIRFQPIRATGVWGWFASPAVRLVFFVSAAGCLLFILYLKRTLQYLDPSSVVPDRVRSTLDSLAEGVLVLDKNQRIVLANRAFTEHAGRTSAQLQGQRASRMRFLVPGSEEPTTELPWAEAFRTGDIKTGVKVDMNGQWGRRTFSVNSMPIMYDGARQRGALVTFNDVTQLEQQKLELEQSKAEAVAASQAKSTFLANMSHEIRTPMNAILGFTDVLRRGLADSQHDRLRYLNTIHTSGEHLLNLINDILDLSKVESGHIEVERTTCRPYEIVADVLAVLMVRAQEKGLRLDMETSDQFPETITSDPLRLRQIITNLVGNALKFTHAGSVVVRLSCRTEGEPQVIFEVIDTGVGMSADALKKIFDPFTQADSSVTREYGGTGLGLTISRRFAEALGGSIQVASEPGRGSTFAVCVSAGPLDGVRWLSRQQMLQALAERHQPAAPTQTTLFKGSPRILVADDGEANRQLIELVLSRAGAQVVAVENGEEAVRRASREKFDIIFMDMQMPVKDGYTATRQLREQGLQTPIVALTANAMAGDEEKCRAAGCSGFLSKPVNLDQLLATVAAEVGTSACAARETTVLEPVPMTDLETIPSSRQAVVSSLPLSDPKFRAIAVAFVKKLRQQLQAMQDAWERRDLTSLAELAHWLKGTGGTVGFHVFTTSAKALELDAKAGQTATIPERLAELTRLADSIEIPGVTKCDTQPQPEARELEPTLS